jgi:hypothetical protein
MGILGHSWCCWKALGKSDIIDFISQFSELSCEKTLIFESILLLEIPKNCNNWLWKENSVHIVKFRNFQF